MKTYHRFWTVMAIPCWFVAQAGASFDGNDDFNDNTKNSQLWGTEFLAGSGAIGETNQHLEYVEHRRRTPRHRSAPRCE